MNNWNELAAQDVVARTVEALKAHNITAHVVATAAEAKRKALELIPAGSEVLTNSSITVDQIGLGTELNDSGQFISLKKKMYAMDRATQGREIAALVAAPAVAVGSVHAVSASGSLFIASMSGSNLAGYVFGAGKVVFVVSTKKITTDDALALRRVYDHVLPQETVRARQAYGLPDSFHSNVNTLLTINGQTSDRIHVVFFAEDVGF